jgi:hypothetical protein
MSFGSDPPKPPPPPPPPRPPNQLAAKQLSFAKVRATPPKIAGFRSLMKTRTPGQGFGLNMGKIRTSNPSIIGG